VRTKLSHFVSAIKRRASSFLWRVEKLDDFITIFFLTTNFEGEKTVMEIADIKLYLSFFES
jgi:hypothetical protein